MITLKMLEKHHQKNIQLMAIKILYNRFINVFAKLKMIFWISFQWTIFRLILLPNCYWQLKYLLLLLFVKNNWRISLSLLKIQRNGNKNKGNFKGQRANQVAGKETYQRKPVAVSGFLFWRETGIRVFETVFSTRNIDGKQRGEQRNPETCKCRQSEKDCWASEQCAWLFVRGNKI